MFINPLIPRSDQYINSPYNFNILSSRQVMRIEKIINLGILSSYNTKFSGIVNKEMKGNKTHCEIEIMRIKLIFTRKVLHLASF